MEEIKISAQPIFKRDYSRLDLGTRKHGMIGASATAPGKHGRKGRVKIKHNPVFAGVGRAMSGAERFAAQKQLHAEKWLEKAKKQLRRHHGAAMV